MAHWPSDEMMLLIARENNLSETAFIVREVDGYRLRWFTPGTEVSLIYSNNSAYADALKTVLG